MVPVVPDGVLAACRYAHDLVETMFKADGPDFGAASDGELTRWWGNE